MPELAQFQHCRQYRRICQRCDAQRWDLVLSLRRMAAPSRGRALENERVASLSENGAMKLLARAVELHEKGLIDAQIKSATNGPKALTDIQIGPLKVTRSARHAFELKLKPRAIKREAFTAEDAWTQFRQSRPPSRKSSRKGQTSSRPRQASPVNWGYPSFNESQR